MQGELINQDPHRMLFVELNKLHFLQEYPVHFKEQINQQSYELDWHRKLLKQQNTTPGRWPGWWSKPQVLVSAAVMQLWPAHKDIMSSWKGIPSKSAPNMLYYQNLKMVTTFNPASRPTHAFVTVATCHGCFFPFFKHWSTLLSSAIFPSLSLRYGISSQTNRYWSTFTSEYIENFKKILVDTPGLQTWCQSIEASD